MRPMEPIKHLVQNAPLIALHLFAALAALVVGIVVMLRRKGTYNHKVMGWVWAAMMGTTALASAFIRDYRMPNIMGYTPIHLLTLFVAIMLPLAIVRIRQGRVQAHRKMMQGMFYGACVVAGLFTLLPGRFLGNLVWKHWLGLVA